MGDDDGDEDQGEYGVDELCKLHLHHAREEKREYQIDSGHAHNCATPYDDPKNHFLTGVEFVRWDVHPFRENTAPLGKPYKVASPGQIVLCPD